MPSNPADASDDVSTSEQRPLSADELLPPVEPPGAGFILQLFVVPALIVLAVFLLVLVLGWMRSAQEDPLAKVEALRAGNQARWQQAFELAQMMVNAEVRFPGLKQNRELARQVAALLDEEVEAAREDDDSVNLRYYLCRILGEFQVDDGMGVLLRTARVDEDRDVRREAINAAVLLINPAHRPERHCAHAGLFDRFAPRVRTEHLNPNGPAFDISQRRGCTVAVRARFRSRQLGQRGRGGQKDNGEGCDGFHGWLRE